MEHFIEELEQLLVKYKLDQTTPGFIMASYIYQMIRMFNLGVKKRDVWINGSSTDKTEI